MQNGMQSNRPEKSSVISSTVADSTVSTVADPTAVFRSWVQKLKDNCCESYDGSEDDFYPCCNHGYDSDSTPFESKG
jgi:hypothetical protein